MVIRAETTSRLTFDNNAAASEKAACRGGGGAAAGVATRPGEPRLGRGITGEPGTRSTPPPRCSPPPTRDRTTRVVDISDASCRRCPPAAFRRRRFPLSSASRKKIAEKRIQVFFFLLFFFCEGEGGGRNFNRPITCNLTQIRRRKFSYKRCNWKVLVIRKEERKIQRPARVLVSGRGTITPRQVLARKLRIRVGGVYRMSGEIDSSNDRVGRGVDGERRIGSEACRPFHNGANRTRAVRRQSPRNICILGFQCPVHTRK